MDKKDTLKRTCTNKNIYTSVLIVIAFLAILFLTACDSTDNYVPKYKPPINPIKYCCPDGKCIDALKNMTQPDGTKFDHVFICDADNFYSYCAKNNGVIIVNDLHPPANAFYECYPAANDTNSSCMTDNDCVYYCDYEAQINRHQCNQITQIKKDEKDASGGNLYRYSYLCNDLKKPGICSAGPRPKINQGGKIIKYSLEGNHLIKEEFPGPVS
jgi:hypothetical protein